MGGSSGMIKTDADRFVDEYGRTLLLRGVNVSGSAKLPAVPNGATWRSEGFFDHRNVSFVGRPFPLEEADEHFARLKAWGFTLVRFLITWEAIEHAGPGLYDTVYLDYLLAIIEKAAEHDIRVFIDPHQDVWSRFSGGSGAPGWTFEVVGMDMTKFQATGAAIVHAVHGDPYPQMIWPTNEGKLANLTMWTLFFGGDDFAPQTRIEGEPVQQYLQTHYINAVKQVAQRLRNLPNVVGYETLNEPSAGLIGMEQLRRRASRLAQGPCPTAFQAMRLGAGFTEAVPVWDVGLLGEHQVGVELINQEAERAWLPQVDPIWAANGVWDVDHKGSPRLLRPRHFTRVRGRRVQFHRDYFKPFANRFTRAIRSVRPDSIIFVEGAPRCGPVPWSAADAPNVAYAPHWYDFFTLFVKRFSRWLNIDTFRRRPVIGLRSIIRSFSRQIRTLLDHSRDHMNCVPTLIGEVGIPFDMERKRAYRTGDFSRQTQAMDATMRALERNLVSFTLWNYNPVNTNLRGDLWNDEDLSIFSRDQQQASRRGSAHRIDAGGRALKAVVRPHARKIAGKPLHMGFDMRRRRFRLRFRHDPTVTAPTEIYVPAYQYPTGARVLISDGTFELDCEAQTLLYRHTQTRALHWVRVDPAG